MSNLLNNTTMKQKIEYMLNNNENKTISINVTIKYMRIHEIIYKELFQLLISTNDRKPQTGNTHYANYFHDIVS